MRIGVPRNYYWESLDGEVARIMETSLDKLRGAGAVFVDFDFGDLANAALIVSAVLRQEGFRVDLAEFLAHEYPGMSMKDAGLQAKPFARNTRMHTTIRPPARM